jgi:CDP-diacylglycerol--serine O-phosphatidyltransferase
MGIKRNIPNFITLLNLLSGCIAIIFIFDGNLPVASYLVFLAALFDFFDGMVARLLKVKSDIGKELDSLADVVSFGLVPGFIMMKLIESAYGFDSDNSVLSRFLPYLALLIPVFSSLRLAKFNIDDRQTDRFIGLPTPANAILIASMPLILEQHSTFTGIELNLFQTLFINFWFLILLTLALSYLLVAEISLMSLKFSKEDKKKNQPRYLLLGLSLILLIVLNFAAIPIIFIVFLFISVFFKSKI